MDRGCPWTNYGRALSFRTQNRLAEACSDTDSRRSSLFSQLRFHFLNIHFRPAIAFVFSVSFSSFICYQFSSRSFTLVLFSTKSLFLCQSFSGFKGSSDKWEVKWYLVIRSPHGVITERWLAEGEREPRPELQQHVTTTFRLPNSLSRLTTHFSMIPTRKLPGQMADLHIVTSDYVQAKRDLFYSCVCRKHSLMAVIENQINCLIESLQSSLKHTGNKAM